MPDYEFRQRFHLLDEDRVKSDLSVLPLPDPFSHIRLVSWKKDTAIADSPRLFLVGGPYETAEDAKLAGRQAREALLFWALQRRLPIDLGDGHRRGGLTEAGRGYFSAQLGGPVRDQLHGLDVYERLPGQIFVSTEARAALSVDATTAVTHIATWLAQPHTLTPKQALAAELYYASGFDAPFRSRFITLMTAFEAFMDCRPRPDDVVSLVGALETLVAESAVDKEQRQSLAGSLAWLRKESIGQAGRRIASTLPGKYGNRTSSKFFAHCYELRSTIVHTGVSPPDVDLLDVANELHRFVGDILHQAIGVPPP